MFLLNWKAGRMLKISSRLGNPSEAQTPCHNCLVRLNTRLNTCLKLIALRAGVIATLVVACPHQLAACENAPFWIISLWHFHITLFVVRQGAVFSMRNYLLYRVTCQNFNPSLMP